jgi:hypothetical protein
MQIRPQAAARPRRKADPLSRLRRWPAAWRHGGAATAAAVAAGSVAALLMLGDGAFSGADAPRAALSLLAFLMVALGMAAAVESMRGIFALMEGADERRRGGIILLAPAPSARMQAVRLLAMSPEQRRRMTRAR